MNLKITNFNIRVYGILIEKGHVLVSKEIRSGFEMLKFPGGGLEKGEGIEACIMREFKEELGIEVEIKDHFYVNEFLQVSAFNPADQLISFYYNIATNQGGKIPIDKTISQEKKGDFQSFHWIEIPNLLESEFTFPIDKVVAKLLRD
ncbi:NUDIX domain-containing protein [Crocinitomix sp.]|nr:NUDIX domain-containing protein [Crocinitomix sp.]